MAKGPKQTFFQRTYTNGQWAHENLIKMTNHKGNANYNYNGVFFHSCQIGYHKEDKIISAGKHMGKRVICTLLVGLYISIISTENSLEYGDASDIKNTITI